MNTPISFPLAKLLKEKGYGNKTPHKLNRNYYNHKGEYNGDVTDYVEAFVAQKELAHLETIDAPIIADVVMWLYEKHGIWISVDWMKRIKPYESGLYCHLRGTNKDLNQDNFIVINDTLDPGYEVFNSPTEAYESAIEYVLTKLI